MDLELAEGQRAVRDMVRDFAEREIRPAAAHYDERAEFPWDLVRRMGPLGLLGMVVPEAYGGAGMDTVSYVLAMEEIARHDGALALTVASHNSLCQGHILVAGSEEQKRKYLPPHATGEKMACFALTEAGAGSDPAAMQTTATKKDGGYVINGNKLFISVGAEAGIIVVFATIDKSLRHRGVTAFVVDKDNPGVSVGKHENKLGFRGLSSVELIFQDCFVPEESRISEEGRGLRVALETLDVSRVTVGAEAVGISQAAFDASLTYAKERQQFGQPLSNFQAIQWMLADMATRIQAGRLLTYYAAFLLDEGQPFVKEAAMAKLYASEISSFVTNTAIQIHGGYGYTKDYPLERYLRDAKLTEIYEGTSEMQRMTIARNLLRDG